MNIVAIIQARMGSKRLPEKIMKNINGKSLISILLDRVSICKNLDKIIVATTDNVIDDNFVNWIRENTNVKVFRGKEKDVLDRYYRCAKLYKADIIVRITADDPLKDATIIDKAIDFLKNDNNLDYCSNTIKPTYPEGLDIEVFRFEALYQAWNCSKLLSEREHVTPYIWKNPNHFNIKNFEYETDLSNWRWTVDYSEDLEFIREIFKHFNKDFLINFEEIIQYLYDNPAIKKINSEFERNEGYLNSILREK